jgi:hypothetical protein
MQTVEVWKRSVVVSAVFVILAAIYFSGVHASYTDLVLTAPSIVASSETEGAIAVQYLKPSPFAIPYRKPSRQSKAAVSLRAAPGLPESNVPAE